MPQIDVFALIRDDEKPNPRQQFVGSISDPDFGVEDVQLILQMIRAAKSLEAKRPRKDPRGDGPRS